ncbi:hypothetical protein D9M72_491660 [compost metagenome]
MAVAGGRAAARARMATVIARGLGAAPLTASTTILSSKGSRKIKAWLPVFWLSKRMPAKTKAASQRNDWSKTSASTDAEGFPPSCRKDRAKDRRCATKSTSASSPAGISRPALSDAACSRRGNRLPSLTASSARMSSI